MAEVYSAEDAGIGAPSTSKAANTTYSADEAGVGKDPGKAGPPAKQGGYLRNIWAAVHEGVSDLAKISELQPWRMALEGFDEITGLAVAPRGVSAGVLQAPAVTGVEPATTGENAARIGTRGALGMIGGQAVSKLPGAAGLGVGSFVRAAPVGAVAALGGAAAADVVPEPWKDVASLAGQLVGGGLVIGGEAAVRAGARAGGMAVKPMNLGESTPIIDPSTGQPFTRTPGMDGGDTPPPITGTAWERQVAGGRLAHAMGADDPGTAAASIPQGPWGGPPPASIPGAVTTLGQQTGDLGVLGLERTLRNTPYGRAAFTAAEAQTKLAQQAALDSIAPEAAAEAAGSWFRAQLAAERAAADAEVQAARAGAGQAVEASGATDALPDVQTIGKTQQGALEATRLPQKSAASAALDAIDPDKSLALDLSDLGKRAREIADDVGEGGALEGPERQVLEAASRYRGVELFHKLRSLQRNTSAAMRRFANSPEFGPESPPHRRMAQLMAAIDDAMAGAVERAAGSTSNLAPGDRIVDRLSDVGRGSDANAGGVSGVVSEAVQPGGTAGPAPVGGAVSAGAPIPDLGAGPGGAGGGGGVAPEVSIGSVRERQPQSLVAWIISKGGMRGDSDFTAMGADDMHHQGAGRLINNGQRGLPADTIRELGIGEGFWGNDADINTVKDAVSLELSGKKQYRAHEEAIARQAEQDAHHQRLQDENVYAARQKVVVAIDEEGVKLSPAQIDHATDLMTQDPNLHAGDAIRQAARGDDERALGINTQKDALDLRPGLSPEARQGEADLAGGRTMVENMTPTTRDEIRAARRDYAIYKTLNRMGVVGEVLARGVGGMFKLGDAMVPGKLFQGGPQGALAADQLIAQQGGVAQAQAVIGDAAALAYRNDVIKNGEVVPARHDRWMAKFTPVLDKFPELKTKFGDAGTAQKFAEEAAIRGVERVEAYEASAARVYLAKGNEGVTSLRAIDNLMGTENPGGEARALMKQAANDPAAVAGIRRNVIEWLENKARTTAEVGTTGTVDTSYAVLRRTLDSPKVAAALDAILEPAQRTMLRRVVDSMQQTARGYNAVKIPGSPGTAADWHALTQQHGPMSVLGNMLIADRLGQVAAAGAGLGGLPGVVVQTVAAVGGALFHARRAAGFERADALLSEAVLNPSLGRVLLQEMSAPQLAAHQRSIAQQMLAVTTVAGLDAMGPREK